jgi:hypothetical protein
LKPLDRLPTFCPFLDPLRGDATFSFCNNSVFQRSLSGRSARRPCAQRFVRFVVLMSVLLIAWGGPCERLTCPADSKSAPGVMGDALLTESHSGVDRPGYAPGLPDIDRDILDDDEENEDPDCRCVLGLLSGLTAPLHQAARMRSAPQKNGESGQFDGCRILRC